MSAKNCQKNVKFAVLGIVGAIAASYTAYHYLAVRRLFTAAEQAYETAQCQDAIANYQAVLNQSLPFDPQDWQLQARVKRGEKDCETFYNQQPEGCPAKGPVQRYTLKPGQYDVVVKSVTQKTVRPFAGTWQLNSNAIYSSCFFIVPQEQQD
ncbi:MAG: hypothetical protein SAJ12_02510 [Jaaginema sp. PMC 1079.18]|nr:hypothetical protein [Jaaginema sp. PMC 1080.18]MEC4849862.1 hypothetical protein [Jaaginema sp. PMC 1079.18]MEC4865250.1 hypothetical protein [Jaaginema sp. PMC 1078.18]